VRLDVFLVVTGEFLPSLVVVLFDVEGHRKVVEDLLALFFVESFHVVVQSFFVAEIFVAFEVVVDEDLTDFLQLLSVVAVFALGGALG
jgi:hypothetical protein